MGEKAQFLGTWEAKKKRGHLILACIHYYIENFQELNLGRVFVSTPTSKNMILLLCFLFDLKVGKILKGSLDLIPSHSLSVKIQIIGGKFA